MTGHRSTGTPKCRVRAVVLAAGLGTRLRPLTNRMPKCLVRVGGRPLLDYWFAQLAEAGIRDVLINTHHLAEHVRAYVERINASGRFHVMTAHEPELLGSAGTVRANRNFVQNGEECLIIYADNLSDVDLVELMRVHRTHNDPITMMLFHAPRPERCGIADMDEAGRITHFIEKPDNPSSDLANGGVYAVSSAGFHEIADMDVFDLARHAMPAFLGRMRGWVWHGYHCDIGTHEALHRAQTDAQRIFAETAVGGWA